MYKLIQLANGRYFQGFQKNGMIQSTTNPLEAKMFIPKKPWFEEVELMEALEELENRVECKVVVLNYTIENY